MRVCRPHCELRFRAGIHRRRLQRGRCPAARRDAAVLLEDGEDVLVRRLPDELLCQ